MIHNIFTIHDVKASAYLPPFILPKAQMAIRTFSDCVNSPEHQFSKHPADYTLFMLGTFDDSTATITLFRGAESLGNGVEFVQEVVMDDLFATEGDSNGTTESQERFKKQVSDDPSVQPSPKGGNSKE